MNTSEMKELVSRIMKVNRLHRSVIADNTGTLRLQRSGHMMLLYVMHRETPPSQKDIADSFGITPAAVAMTLKKMEKSGLIERTPSDNDNRINLIRISKAGRELLESNRQSFEAADRAMLSGIPDNELESVSRTLDKMIENLINVGARDDAPPYAPKGRK